MKLGYHNGIFYDENEKPANWWYDDGSDWYYFKDGKKLTGEGIDSNGKHQFKNGKYLQGYKSNIFYQDGNPCNWWADDGKAWYFFKDGKKLTGEGTDANGKHKFKNGKYLTGYLENIFYEDGDLCNWWCDDGKDWFFFKDGKKLTGFAVDSNGKRYFVNGKYANGIYDGKLYKDGVSSKGKVYVNGIFYDENEKPANWWYDDGEAWYFFKDGKKLTGEGTDANGKHKFKNGKYLTGYLENIFYEDGDLCNWWCDDGKDWFFFKDGKKLTGFAVDSNGKRYFVNGKYANGIYDGKLYKDGVSSKGKVYVNGIFYDENEKPANWWYDDGEAWYFFKDGKKLTGEGTDANGSHYFANGKYANGIYNGKLYKDGAESEGKVYVNGIFYDENKKPANWWYDDGTDWFYFKDGKKLTGEGTDASGSYYFANGKYANGVYNGTFYADGKEVSTVPESAMIYDNLYAYDFDKYTYYTGCWLLSASSGLYSKGVEIDPDHLLALLPKTANPTTGVMGDPHLHGYMGVFPAAYPTALVPTLKTLLPTVQNITGFSIDAIKFELSRGNTVQVWFSRVEPTTMEDGDETFEVSRDYHSILLRGYDENGFYCLESAYGNTTSSFVPYNSTHWRYDHFIDGYNRFGKKAIVYRLSLIHI